MSLAQTSFWKSTNALAHWPIAAAAVAEVPPPARGAIRRFVDARQRRREARPHRRRGAAPARRAVASASARPNVAVAGAGRALALRRSCPARTSCRASSKRRLPRDCENRCTLGVQPPDISSASQAMPSPRPPRRDPLADATRSAPARARDRCARRRIRGRRARAACSGTARRSRADRRSRAISTPAACEIERRAIGAVVGGRDDDRACRPSRRSG